MADTANELRRLLAKKPAPVPSHDKFGREMDPKAWAAVQKHEQLVQKWARHYDVDPDLVRAVIYQESKGHAGATSRTGVRGVMQVTQDTYDHYSTTGKKRTDPEGSIEAGTHYLSDLLKQYGGDVVKTLAHYNSGGQAGRAPHTARDEGRRYVEQVLNINLAKDYTPEKRWQHAGFEQGTQMPDRAGLAGAPGRSSVGPLSPPEPKRKPAEHVQVADPFTEREQAPKVDTDEGPKLVAELGEQRRIPWPDLPPARKDLSIGIQVPDFWSPEDQAKVQKKETEAADLAREQAFAKEGPGEVFKAAGEKSQVFYAIERWIGENQAAAMVDPDYRVDPKRLEADIQQWQLPADRAMRLLEAKNQQHYNAILTTLQLETDAERKLMLVSPAAMLGLTLGQAVLDPALAPANVFGGRALVGAERYSALGRAGRVGAEAGAGAMVGSAQELALRAGVTPNMTHEDVIDALALGAVAGAALPGGIEAALGRSEVQVNKAIRDAAAAHRRGTPPPTKPAGGVTAPSAPPREIGQEQVVKHAPVQTGPQKPEPRLEPTMGTVAPQSTVQALVLGPEPIVRPLDLSDRAPEGTPLPAGPEAPGAPAEAPPTPTPTAPAQAAPEAPVRPEEAAVPAPTAEPAKPEYKPGDAISWTDKDGSLREGTIKRVTPEGRLVVEDLDTGKATRIEPEQADTAFDPVLHSTPLADVAEEGAEKGAEEAAAGFLPGSVGAAQGIVVKPYAELIPHDAGELPSSFGGKLLRWDAAGQLKRLANPFVKWFAHKAPEDPVGLNADGTPAFATAEEDAWVLKHKTLGIYQRKMEAAFDAADQGGSMVGRAERRAAFGERAVRAYDANETLTDPNIAMAVSSLREFFETYRTEGKASGTEYMANLVEQRTYVPHILDYERFRVMVERYGEGQVSKLLADSLILKDLQDGLRTLKRGGKGNVENQAWVKLARTVAQGYVRNVLRRGHWGDLLGPHGTDVGDPAISAQLREMGVDQADLDVVLQRFRKEMDGSGPARARPRFDFEMGHADELTVTGGEGKGRKERVDIGSFFSRDPDYLTRAYANQMAGHIAMARTANIKSRADFMRLLREAAEWNRNNPGMDSVKDFDRALRAMHYVYDAVTGNPLELDPGSVFSTWARRLRGVNFLRVMNQVGFSQVAELGRSLGTTGFRAMVRQMPALRDILEAAKGNKLSNPLFREIEAATGIGTHRLLNQPFTSTLTKEGDLAIGGKIDRALHTGRNIVADISGMNFLTTIQQRMSAAAFSQRLVDQALAGKTKFDREIASLGWDEKMAARVFDHLKTKTTLADGRQLHQLRLEEWDPTVANAFVLGLTRMTKRVVQESSYGGTMEWMHTSPLAKLMLQFRSFSVNAVYKQTMQGVAQRDIRSFMSFQLTMLFGGLAYVAQTLANESDPERLEKLLSTGKIAAAAFNKSGYSSLIPMFVDSTVRLASAGTHPGVFSHARSTGLGTGVFAGNPTIDLINKATRGSAAVPNAALRDDYDFSQADARALFGTIPFQNALGIRRALNAFIQRLPRESTTENYWQQD